MAAGQLSHQSAWRNAVHSGDGRDKLALRAFPQQDPDEPVVVFH